MSNSVDLLVDIVKSGTTRHVDKALRQFTKDINKWSACEITPLHVAVWRNHTAVVGQLLKAGSNPDLQDGESGWTGLHHALYFGHLRVVAQLLAAGASLDVVDNKGRTPLDLVSHQLKSLLPSCRRHAVYSWGSGVNFQLGTGSADLRDSPVRIDSLAPMQVSALAAAKFHSAAIGSDGAVYTWGWGRGGRLGHPDFHIHSGEAAQIAPRPVTGLGRRQVVSLAAAKHHMLAATTSGEMYSWGSNQNGKLGYGGTDVQPTPRKVAALLVRVVLVAAANKHSVAVTSLGEVFTWGGNGEGQLGYSMRDVAGSPNPRLVEALKGKRVSAAAASKRHTVVLLAGGELFTWGHQQPTPRRVKLEGGRQLLRADGSELQLHRGRGEAARPVAVGVAAGAVHSCAVTACGHVLYWWSADPSLTVHELRGPIAGCRVLSVSASKFRSAAVTDDGDVWVWEGETAKAPEARTQERQEPSRHGRIKRAAFGEPVMAQRVPGIKRVTQVAVGEKHTLARQSWAAVELPDPEAGKVVTESHWEEAFDAEFDGLPETPPPAVATGLSRVEQLLAGGSGGGGLRSLQDICQSVVATQLVEPRSVLQILEYADLAGAELLRQTCLMMALRNLDAVLVEASGALESMPPALLAELESSFKAAVLRAGDQPPPHSGPLSTVSSSDQLSAMLGSSPSPSGRSPVSGGQSLDSEWLLSSYRPHAVLAAPVPGLRPSAPPTSLADTAAASHLPGVLGLLGSSPWRDGPAGSPQGSDGCGSAGQMRSMAGEGSDAALPAPGSGSGRLQRVLHRKLQQMSLLEARQATGVELDSQQLAKLGQKAVMQEALRAMERGATVAEVQDFLSQAQALSAKLDGAAGAARGARPRSSAPGRSPAQGSREVSTTDLPALAAAEAAATLSDTQQAAVPASSAAAGASPLTTHSTPSTSRELPPPDLSPSSPQPGPPSGSKARAPKWKGGLSMFLNSPLDMKRPSAPTPKEEPAARAPAGPAWGGARSAPAAASSSNSLRDILGQQQRPAPPANSSSGGTPRAAATPAPPVPGSGDSRLPLAAFFPSPPVPVSAKRAEKAATPSTSPAWGSVPGSSPPSSTFSLRDIQSEQLSRRIGAGPVSQRAAAAPVLPSGSSPPATPSKWYVPERVSAQPMSEIQSEEVVRSILEQQEHMEQLARQQEEAAAAAAALATGRGQRRGTRQRVDRGDADPASSQAEARHNNAGNAEAEGKAEGTERQRRRHQRRQGPARDAQGESHPDRAAAAPHSEEACVASLSGSGEPGAAAGALTAGGQQGAVGLGSAQHTQRRRGGAGGSSNQPAQPDGGLQDGPQHSSAHRRQPGGGRGGRGGRPQGSQVPASSEDASVRGERGPGRAPGAQQGTGPNTVRLHEQGDLSGVDTGAVVAWDASAAQAVALHDTVTVHHNPPTEPHG